MRPADLTPVARDVAKVPASVGLMFFSLATAFLVSALPWSGKWLLARPDLVLLVLLFWTVNQPRSLGQGMAFFMGLLMDVSDSMLLGQHALGYVVAVFGAQTLRHRILTFPLPEQTLHVLGLALAASLTTLALNLALGADSPRGIFLPPPLSPARLWAPANWFLYSPTVRRRRREMSS